MTKEFQQELLKAMLAKPKQGVLVNPHITVQKPCPQTNWAKVAEALRHGYAQKNCNCSKKHKGAPHKGSCPYATRL